MLSLKLFMITDKDKIHELIWKKAPHLQQKNWKQKNKTQWASASHDVVPDDDTVEEKENQVN